MPTSQFSLSSFHLTLHISLSSSHPAPHFFLPLLGIKHWPAQAEVWWSWKQRQDGGGDCVSPLYLLAVVWRRGLRVAPMLAMHAG